MVRWLLVVYSLTSHIFRRKQARVNARPWHGSTSTLKIGRNGVRGSMYPLRSALCTLTWLAMASDQLTEGSLHSKAAARTSLVGRSVFVLSNEQAQHFLRLLGNPEQAAEPYASMVRAPKKVVRWKSCVSSVIPSSKGRGDEASHIPHPTEAHWP